jgi:hypothetical protein
MLCPNTSVCLKWAHDYKNISIILEEVDTEEKYSTPSLMDENSKALICPLADGVMMIICPLADGVMMTLLIAMIMRVGDPLLERIDEIIQRVVEARIFMQWKKSHFDKVKLGSGTLHSYSILDDYHSFTLEHMQPAFSMLLMDFCISTLILLLELTYHRVIHLRSSVFNNKRG